MGAVGVPVGGSWWYLVALKLPVHACTKCLNRLSVYVLETFYDWCWPRFNVADVVKSWKLLWMVPAPVSSRVSVDSYVGLISERISG